jgi:PAS domain S-box-containing protein
VKVLNLEDDPRDSALIERELRKRFDAVELLRVDTPEAFTAAVGEGGWDIIIADHHLPRFDSAGALAVLKASGREIPLVVVSGTMGLTFAVDAMRAGARDYLVKEDLVRLCAVVERELRDAEASRVASARHALTAEVLEVLNAPGELAPQLRRVLDLVLRHAGADAGGIRLRTKEDFPYAVHAGLGPAFVEAEETLCEQNAGGQDHRAPGGVVELACLCGAVLLQRPQAAGLLTARGAYLSGPGSSLDENASQLPFPRGRCTQEGFRSLALVPLRSGSEVVGLLQLSARPPGRFAPDLVQFLEEISPGLGLAIERRRAEESRRVSEERYRVLVETSPNGVALAATDTTILKANRQLTALLGFDDAAELEGRKLFDFVVERDRERAEVERARLVKGGALPEVPLRFCHGDAAFDGEVSGTMTRGEGQGTSMVLVVRDVTERQKLQARLAQSDRMASVGMLAAGVAHEINNPLAYVLANLEGLAADLPVVEGRLPPGEVPAELAIRAREALDGARRIREIVRDLKVFSRIGDDRLGPVSLNEVIEGVLHMTHNEIKYRAALVTDFGRLPPVRANEGRLAQVFLNLVLNAAQAIREGDVERNSIRVRTWAEPGFVFAEVSDTGSGISEAVRGRIFEPFFTTKPAGVGSGLGLAISRGIVEEAGGRISLESRPDEGARFVVRLPAAGDEPSAKPPAPGPSAQPAPKGRRGRVLVVDDEAMIRSTLTRLLKLEHEVVAVASGHAAESLLAVDDGFDVVLCDLIMPEVSGMDLHDSLAVTHPELAARMVFMSGGAFTERARAFFESVPNMRLEKPFDVANLRELVRVRVAARPVAEASP